MNKDVRLSHEELIKMWRRWLIVGLTGCLSIAIGLGRESDLWLYPGLLLTGLGIFANLLLISVWIKRKIKHED